MRGSREAPTGYLTPLPAHRPKETVLGSFSTQHRMNG